VLPLQVRGLPAAPGKRKPAELTTSKPRPLNILSVVATTFPPFRCRSHMILRRETCGNICCILSTSASLARMLFADVVLRFGDDVLPDEKKKYRIASAPSTINRSSCGRPIVWSAILSVPGGLGSGRWSNLGGLCWQAR
jgi:hypothetical protein